MGYLSDFLFGSSIYKRKTVFDNKGNRSGYWVGGSSQPTSGSECKTGYTSKQPYDRSTRRLRGAYQCVRNP